jgi:(S)-2-hydroxyglutarate dehydrogenase
LPALTADFLVIGGGVIGLRLALEIKARHTGATVVLLEKEKQCGTHASGRNSGVLHAGFYYSPDSMKAAFTRDGNQRMRAYCRERGLAVNECGKLVVARNENENGQLDELLRRARANSVELHEVDEKQAREIEPRARTFKRALFSPTTASVSPAEVMAALAADASAAGIDVRTETEYVTKRGADIITSRGRIAPGYVVNAGGLYADRIARHFGFSQGHRVVPFKGVYLAAHAREESIRTHIYPVPDLRMPFLGVHFTVTVDNKVKIGPTAIPAFWREQYAGVSRFSTGEFVESVFNHAGMIASNRSGVRNLAAREVGNYWKPTLIRRARTLVDNLDARLYHWGPAGIRAQLIRTDTRELELDFFFEGDDRSFHVLNAVSPAFTCSFSFCEYLLDKIDGFRN